MSVAARTTTAPSCAGVLLRDEAHLCRVLGVPFSDEQLAAITSPLDAPSVVVAGAGSGKTTVMAARVVWLVGRGEVAPERVLGLTFTTKAAAELDHRVRAALERLADDAGLTGLLDDGAPTVSTYHAFAGSLLAEFGPLLGCEPDLEVVADASRHLRALRVVTAHRHRVEHLSTHLPTVVGDLLALDGQLADHLVDPEVLRAHGRSLRDDLARADRPGADVRDAVTTSSKREELLDLVVAYRRAKHDDGVLDFSDQMAWGARLALAGPEVPVAVRERFGVVLLDEYQDTSVAQRDMLRGLFSGPDASAGRGHPVTAVGDPCQGIYGWRGAAADNLTGFADDFPTADGGRGPAHGLRVNRRCAARVLDVANTIAAPYYATSEHVRPLLAPDDAPPGRVRAALLPTVTEEVEWVADQVAATPADADGSRWRRVAVLVRDRSEVGALVAALRARQVPVEVLGLAGLLQTPAVQDVRAALEVLGDVCANGSLLRLLTGPRWRIGPRDLALLGRRARLLAGPGAAGAARTGDPDAALLEAVQGQDPAEVVALAEAVEDPGDLPYDPEARRRLREVATLLRQLRGHVGDPLPDLVRRVVTALDLDVELGALAGADGRVARDHLAAFGEVVGTFAAREPGAGLAALLTHLRASDDYEDGLPIEVGAEGDAVSVLTAHQAKGLEWDVVHVPFLSGGVFPSAKARPRWTTVAAELPVALRGDAHLLPDVRDWTRDGFAAYRQEGRADAEMEELRLAYVAFTRARHEVVASGHVWGRTRKRPRLASDYLVTVRDRLRRHGEDAETWAPDPGPADVNPLASATITVSWPAEPDTGALGARAEAAARVRALLRAGDPVATPLPDSDPDADLSPEWERLAQIDADLSALLAEAAEAAVEVVDVPVPVALSTTALLRLRRDPDGFLRDLVRPMPRPPASRARLGTRFHGRVEALLGQPALLADTELPGRQDADVADEAELDALVEAFGRGRYGDRVPHAVEVPFTLWVAGRRVTGRIDAVFATDKGWQVVDWKTGRGDADPGQLAVYRLAWAELAGVDPDAVDAVFYEVRRDAVVRPDLPGRAELEAVLREPPDDLT